jgi:transposase
MDVLYRCCAGLDVHKKTVVACVRRLGDDGQFESEVLTFGTTTAELLALSDWLAARGVTHAAMESTGIYRKPVWRILEGAFELLLVNARHIKQVPGRKTDVKDSQWIAQLLQHGLLSASFVPPPEIRELRDLTRQRAQLVAQRATVVNRIQKVLEDANIKLSDVATDVMGKSGRAMIEAMIAGQEDPEELADEARGSLRGKRPELVAALRGSVTEHHRFLLGSLMGQVRFLEGELGRFAARIEARMAPSAEAERRLVAIPGMGPQAAEVVVAEIGTDMGRFPTADHLSSWAGMCPGNDVSAGKRRSGRTTKGSRWLRATLVQVAWAASHTKTRLGSRYRRWAKRLGRKKALVALGHRILVIIYKLLKDGVDYVERPEPEPST